MTKGKPCNYFILIIEGRVKVQIGKEEHEFEAGPFNYYGVQVIQKAKKVTLSQERSPAKQSSIEDWVPDYTLMAASDLLYVKIDRDMYIRGVMGQPMMSRQISQSVDSGEPHLPISSGD